VVSARIGDALLAFGFAAAIAAQPLASLLRRDAGQSARAEFRKPEPFPPRPRSLADAAEWPRRFEAWYGDHFGLREPLLRAHNRVLWSAFAVSPTDKFLLGRDGWVFVTDARSLDVYRGALPMGAPRLTGWRDMLAARGAWLAERGARYMVVIAPSKEQVYGEHLPARWGEPGATRVDQLLEAARGIEHCELVDLRDCLRAEKARDGQRGEDDVVYYPLGTHWTDRGAFAAEVELAQRLARHFPAVRPLAREDFDVAERGEGDSLASQLYMEDELAQKAWRWTLGARRRARYDDAKIDAQDELDTEVDDPALPSAVVLHDSFGPGIRPMLAEHFSRAAFVWGLDFDAAVLEPSQPDVVIELFIDRTLFQSPPQLWPIGDPTRARRAFDASPRVALTLDRARVAPAVSAGERTNLREEDGELHLRSPATSPSLELPRVRIERDELVALRLEVASQKPSGIDVHYTKTRERGFDRRNTTYVPLARGDNEVYVEILDDELDGGFLLRFAEPRCDYALRSVEVRARRR
jgi:hypothetical protein